MDQLAMAMQPKENELSLLLIGAGAMAEGYLDAAQAAGISVAVVESEPRLQDLRVRYSCITDEEPLVGPPGADEAWVLPSMTLADRYEPHGVLGFAEPQALAAALVQTRCGLPGPGLTATAISRNKALQRSFFARAGLGQPDSRLGDELSTATEWAVQRFPVVVKPLSRMGSSGVERIDDQAAWADVLQRRHREGPLLVEEYIDGEEYSIEGLVRDGELIFSNLTRKETSGAPYFVEMAHTVTGGSDDTPLGSAPRQLLADVALALDIGTGIVHLEFKDCAHGDLAIMEVAVRTPGDHIMEVISLAYDFNLYRACIDLALSKVPQLPRSHTVARSAGVAYIAASRAGMIEMIDTSAWTRIEGITRSHVMAGIGDNVRPPESSADRLGYGVFECADPEALRSAMSALRELAEIEIGQPQRLAVALP